MEEMTDVSNRLQHLVTCTLYIQPEGEIKSEVTMKNYAYHTG